MKLSIAVPIYKPMKNSEFFIARCLDSIKSQTFTDYEIVMTEAGKMAENTNAAIKQSKGELIKILYQDDYLADDHALQHIVDNFTNEDNWLITGSSNNHPFWNAYVGKGRNTLGSPSALTIRNKDPLLFNESLQWVLDCEYYQRMYDKFGEPKILTRIGVVIGIGDHQETHNLSEEIKQREIQTLLAKEFKVDQGTISNIKRNIQKFYA